MAVPDRRPSEPVSEDQIQRMLEWG
jgi:hypothetical protein